MSKTDIQNFVSVDSSLRSRVFVFLVAVSVWAVGFYYVNPAFQNVIPDGDALSLFLKHVLYFSLSTTLVCVACYYYFLSRGSFKKLRFSFNKKNLAEAAIVALFCSLITIPVAFQFGYHLGCAFDIEKAVGNIFSNTYEEFQYRVLIFFSALYLFQRLIPAALISGFVFAFSHANYPVAFQVLILITGALTAISFYRTKSFVTAIVIHQMIDLILDTILVR